MPKPTYNTWDTVPDNLKTKTQLGQMGLKPAQGQAVVARKMDIKRGHSYRLYDMAEAIPKRPATPAQLAALQKARATAYTCDECYERIPKRQAPTCTACRRDRSRRNAARHEAREWARATLAKKFVILDTETTDLRGEIISLAIISHEEKTLYNDLFHPLSPVSAEATAVHGITLKILNGRHTWADELAKIAAILEAAEAILIYNADFDLGRIAHTSALHNTPNPMPIMSAECLMEQYAKFCGHWSEYHQSFKWQPLPAGDHTALGDCVAALALLRHMAAEGEQTP